MVALESIDDPRPWFRPRSVLDPPPSSETVARACVDAHAHGVPARDVVRVMSAIPAHDRIRPALRSLLDPIRRDLDTVTILACFLVFPFDGASESGFLGGSEEAIVCLARALVQRGRRVVVFTRLPLFTASGTAFDGVEYRDAAAFHPDDEHGTLVVWRQPEPVRDVFDPAFVRPGIFSVHLWMHDVGASDPDAFREAATMCETVSTLSEFHERNLRDLAPDLPCVRVPNGILPDAFELGSATEPNARDSFRVAYTSCPSRGLRVLFELWPDVHRAVPDAVLDVCYDWTAFRHAYPNEHDRMRAQADTLKPMGVRVHGGVSHPELHALLKRTNVWAYSHFHLTHMETFCISAVKATAAGCTVLTTPNGALPETAPEARFVETPGDFRDALVFALQNPEPEDVRRARANRARDAHGWANVARTASDIWTCQRKPESRPHRPTRVVSL